MDDFESPRVRRLRGLPAPQFDDNVVLPKKEEEKKSEPDSSTLPPEVPKSAS